MLSAGWRSGNFSQSKLPPSTIMPPIEVPWPPMIFGGRIDHDRRAVIERARQDRRGGVVHDQRNAEFAADRRDLGDREDRELRVGQGLGVIGAGAVIGGAAESLRVGRIDEADLDALVLQRVGEQVPGAAVEVGRGDDIVAGAGEVLHRIGRGRLAGGHRQRGDAAFERRDALFEHVGRRVPDAGIDVAELLQREQVGGVLGVVELVGGGLVDRHAPPRRWPDRRASRRAGQGFRAFCSRRPFFPRKCLIGSAPGGCGGEIAPPRPDSASREGKIFC